MQERVDAEGYPRLVERIADLVAMLDGERPIHRSRGRVFKPGIGPFGEPQLVKALARRLTDKGVPSRSRRTPDLDVGNGTWGIECKIARPFGDNDAIAENWTINLLHPYPGNESLIGDGLKLRGLKGFKRKGLLVFGFEHDPAKVCLDPLVDSFELVAAKVCGVPLGRRIEAVRRGLVHPVHQVLRCFGWEVQVT